MTVALEKKKKTKWRKNKYYQIYFPPCWNKITKGTSIYNIMHLPVIMNYPRMFGEKIKIDFFFWGVIFFSRKRKKENLHTSLRFVMCNLYSEQGKYMNFPWVRYVDV